MISIPALPKICQLQREQIQNLRGILLATSRFLSKGATRDGKDASRRGFLCFLCDRGLVFFCFHLAFDLLSTGATKGHFLSSIGFVILCILGILSLDKVQVTFQSFHIHSAVVILDMVSHGVMSLYFSAGSLSHFTKRREILL